MKILFSSICASLLFSAATAEFDPGGPTFDFAKLSEARFQSEQGGENLLNGKWRSHSWVHLRDGKRGAELRKQVRDLIVFSQENEQNATILKTVKKKEIEAAAGKDSTAVSGSWIQTVRFPDSAGGQYQIHFDYSSTRTGSHNFSGYVVISCRQGKKAVKALVKPFPVGSGTWRNHVADIGIPAGCNNADFYLRVDGCGEIQFKNPRLERVKNAYPATVILAPGALLDNTFALSQNDPAILAFSWKRNVPKNEWNVRKPMLHVRLPREVRLDEAGSNMPLVRREGDEYVLNLERIKLRPRLSETFDTSLLLSMMVSSSVRPGTELASASYWISDDGKVITEKKSFRFLVIPSIPQAGKSQHYLNGFQPMGAYLTFKEKASKEKWAEFIGRTGSRWLVGNPDPEMRELYRKHGIAMITPELYWVANGYRVGPPENKPEYAKYKAIGNSSRFDILKATCPVAVYRKSDYFKNSIVPYLEKNLRGTDGLIANWEPFMFHGTGCFCDNCRAEFAAYAKISKEEAAKAWPRELQIHGKYHELGIQFRSWQHAQMVRTIHEAVNQASSGKAGFIPEVAWIQMADCHARKGAAGEHDPLDYASSLQYIDPWGPYITWKSLEPYSYAKGGNLNTYIAAKAVVDFTRENLPEGKRPKLLALPHGMQCDFWVTNPEAIAMEVIAFLLAGYDASTVYLFPKGYDNRYWAALAEANSRIAENEDFVFSGETVSSVSVSPFTPYPAPKKRINAKYYSDLPPESLLQAASFRRNGVLLTAVGNFWEKGEVFFKLKAAGLEKGKRYVVRERAKKRAFAGQGGNGFSGTELAEGVLLHVGALRWAFFEIAPWKAGENYGELVSPDTVASEARKRSASLAKEAEAEAVRDAAEDRAFRKSDLKAMRSGALSCTPRSSADGGQVLEFVSGKNSLRLGLNAMAVQSWKIDGVEWISGTASSGLGAPAFWLPSVQLNTPFLVTEQVENADGIRVTAEKILTRKDSPALERLGIRQTLTVDRNLACVTIRTELSNTHDSESGMASLRAGFRYHNLPLCLGKGGGIEMVSAGKKYDFVRRQERMVFGKDPGSASALALKKLFSAPGAVVPIDSPRVVWRMPGTENRVTMSVEPAGAFGGIACWDTPDLAAPSFEPFFHPAELKPGAALSYSLTLRAEK